MKSVAVFIIIISLQHFSKFFCMEYCSNDMLVACINYSPCKCSVERQKMECKLTCRNLDNSLDFFSNLKINDHAIHSERMIVRDVEITLSHLPEINATYMKEFEEVKVLNLSYNELSSVDPDTFQDVTDLESLDLSHNSISNIPSDLLRNLTKLKHLSLAANKIQSINTGCLKDLEMLLRFNLSRNSLTEIPKHLFSNTSRMKVLSLANNKMHILPDEIFDGLNDLETLDLSKNQLTRLQPLFKSLKNLRILSISYNQLRSLEKETFDYVNKTLNYIDLLGNPWSCGESNYWLYLWLQEDSTISESGSKLYCRDTKTNLSRTFCDDIIVIDMIRSIQKCDTCRKCKCELSYKSVIAIVDCRNKNLTYLPQKLPSRTKKVLLDDNEITSLIIEEENIPYWNEVRFLGLNNNSISSLHSLEGLAFLKQIIELNITGNRLIDIPLYLLDQLDYTITMLSLSNNPWSCNCNTVRFQVWLQNHYHHIRDIEDIRCAKDDTYTSNRVIYRMKKSELCSQPSQTLDYLDILNITMGLLILLIISKVTYDYWHQKKTGKLPRFFGFNLP